MQEAPVENVAPAGHPDNPPPQAPDTTQKSPRRPRRDKGQPKKITSPRTPKTLVALVATSLEGVEIPSDCMLIRAPIVLRTAKVKAAHKELVERAQTDESLRGQKATLVMIKGRGIIEVEAPRKPKIIFKAM